LYSQQNNTVRRSYAPWLLVAVWLASAACSFWYFTLRNQRTFESSVDSVRAETWYRQHFSPQDRDVQHTVATVVHLYRADCACNRFTEPHLAQIIARYQRDGVRFVAVVRQGNSSESAAAPVAGLRQTSVSANELDWVDATPAALVYDSAGKLIYFGPYSDAAWCGTSAGLVERALDRTLRGQSPEPRGVPGGGCYCGWKA